MADPQPLFPEITRIDQVLEAIAGFDEFIVAERDGYKVVDYAVVKPGETFGCALTSTGEDLAKALLRRECRGIKFDADGALIARPYHKFFNLGQTPETQAHLVAFDAPHHALKKLDGTMIHPALVHGRDRLMTKMGMTPEFAGRAEIWALEESGRPYAELWRDLRLAGKTPIFEWLTTEKRYQVVINHARNDLVLTGARETRTGAYLPYPDLVRLAKEYKVPVVEAFGSDIEDLDRFVAFIRGLLGEEGTVLFWPGGRPITHLKIKADDYSRRHKAKDGLSQEKNVLGIVIDGKDDDLLPILPEHDREALVQYAAAVRKGLSRTAAEIAAAVADARVRLGGNKRLFVEQVASKLSPLLRPVAFNIWDGAPPIEAVRRQFLHNRHGVPFYSVTSGTEVDRLRPLWGGAAWADMFTAVPMDN